MASQEKTGGKFFVRGWVMIAIAFVVAIITQGFGLYSYGMLKVNLTEALGVSAAAVGGGFSCYTIAISISGLFVGDVIERFGLRVSLWISAVLYGGAFFLLSMVSQLWMVYAVYIIMGIGSAFGGVVVVTAIASNWFVKQRGLATAVIWCGMLPGSLCSTFIVANVGAAAGWQSAAVALGIISAIVLVAASFFLKWRPQDEGLFPDGESYDQEAELEKGRVAEKGKVIGMTRGQALVTVSFWLIFIAYGLNGFAEMGLFQNMSAYLVSEGLEMTEVAAFLSFLSFAGVVGRLCTGVVVDKFGPKIAYLAINVLGVIGIGMLLLGMAGNTVMLYIAGFCFGVNLNSGIICFSNAVARTFGTRHYGQIWGAIFMIKGFGDAVGVPLLAGVAEGSMGWNGSFVISIIGMIVAVVFMLLTRKEKKLVEIEEEAKREALAA
ncbi:MFS transporter [Adlercreutzia sp. ZJ242]|uniref:MFS transporter n=1 Tax=Adlercreutzia sp. ZJ242 TaxID=2709409 RepID=UPI0013EAD6EB|nr:MFS transporter [Adlercreutzia sp. ZJ242]